MGGLNIEHNYFEEIVIFADLNHGDLYGVVAFELQYLKKLQLSQRCSPSPLIKVKHKALNMGKNRKLNGFI